MQLTRQTLQNRQVALIEHYLNRLDDLAQMYDQGRAWAQEALRSFDQEWQQLQAQQEWAVSMAPQNRRAAQLVIAFPQRAKILLMQINPQQATAWIDAALPWIDPEDVRTRYQLLRALHEIQRALMDVDLMRDTLDDLEILAQRLDDHRSRVEVADMKTDYFEMIEDYASQHLWSEKALALAMRSEDSSLIASAYHQLGFACMRIEHYEEAETHMKTALSMFEQLGMMLRVASAYNSLAINAYSSNRFEEGMTSIEQALTITRSVGHRQQELTFLSNLPFFASSVGDLEKALLYGKQAWRMARELGSRSSEQTALGGLLIAVAELGLEDEVITTIEHTRAHVSEIPSTHLDALMAYAMARLVYEQGNWAEACRLAAARAQIDQEIENVEHECDMRLIWGSSLIELGAPDEAITVLTRCLELQYQEAENPMAPASTLASMGYAQLRQGNHDDAKQCLDRFFTLLSEGTIFNVELAFNALWQAYCTCKALNDARQTLLIEAFDTLLARNLGYLHDDSLRSSFLKNINIQRLLAAQSSHT